MKKLLGKTASRWLAIALAAVMVLAMATTVMADTYYENSTEGRTTDAAIATDAPTTGSLTIKHATESDQTYSLYKLYSASVDTGSGTYTWTIVDAFANALKASGSETSYSASDIAAMSSSDLKALATNLETYVTTGAGSSITATATVTMDGTNGGTASNLALGYYLVVGDGSGLTHSQPILVAIPQAQSVTTGEGADAVTSDQWVYAISVTPKESETDFFKKIAVETTENGTTTNTLTDTSTANIGDYVSYRLYADVPSYDSAIFEDDPDTQVTFTITDHMSKELTWGSQSAVSVYVISSENYSDSVVANVTTSNSATAINATETVDSTTVTYYTTSTPTVDTAGGSFTVTFTKDFLKQYGGYWVVVVFSAQINSDAVIANSESTENNINGYDDSTYDANGDLISQGVRDENYNGTGNPNGATLTYSNDYEGGTTTATIKDDVTTFTFQLDVLKTDDATTNATPLQGAEFTVYTDADCQTAYKNDTITSGDAMVLTTDSNGMATGTGLKDGTYYLKETKAPDGYELYTGTITVVITATKDATSGEYTGAYTYTVTMGTGSATELTEAVVTVQDTPGETLPGTGGMGTMLFSVIGILLVAFACVAFVVHTSRRRTRA